MGIVQLGYMGLGVKSLEEWESFAREVLGFAVAERAPDGTMYLRMDEYHHRFVLHPNGSDDLEYLGWEVPTPEDLRAVEEHVKARGVKVTRATPEEVAARKVVDFIWFEDPNGVRQEVFVGPLILWEEPFQPGRPMSGFRTGNLGLGHLIVYCKDQAESVRFYREVMGFKLSDYIDLEASMPGAGTAVFLHCNPRHHSLALVHAPQARKKINHFMVEVNSLDDVGSAYYMVQQRGIPIALTLGKHTNDHMVSFYMVSPSGFDVEYGWGGRLIDDSQWVVQKHLRIAIWGHEPPRRAAGEREARATAGQRR